MNIHPAIIKSFLGSLPGVAVAGIGVNQLLSSHKKSMELAKSDLVDAKKTVFEYEPDAIVATSHSDLKKIKATEDEAKLYAKIMDYVSNGTNAATISNKNAIISPKMINRSLIGHEVGHLRDYRKSGYTLLDHAGIMAKMEGRAWKESPFHDRKAKEAESAMAGTYRGANKIAIGAPMAAAGIMAPFIWKALKK